MRLRTWGMLAVVVATFAAGAKTGVEYAKTRYVSRDRKFIEGKVLEKDEK